MKTPVFPRTVALLVLVSVAPLSAQSPVATQLISAFYVTEDGTSGSALHFGDVQTLPGTLVVPEIERAQSMISSDAPVFVVQNPLSLDERAKAFCAADARWVAGFFEGDGIVRKVKVGTKGAVYRVDVNSLDDGLKRMSAIYREAGRSEASPDCLALALSVEEQIKRDASGILEIVEREVGANASCACEIVKSAIRAIEAEPSEVVAIVEAAIHASPESMRIISQCAIATSPDSVSGVQALLARLDPNAGESGYSSKSAKGAKVATIISEPLPDPLDRPYIPPIPPVPPPPPPPPVTNVNPS